MAIPKAIPRTNHEGVLVSEKMLVDRRGSTDGGWFSRRAPVNRGKCHEVFCQTIDIVRVCWHIVDNQQSTDTELAACYQSGAVVLLASLGGNDDDAV